MIDDELKNYIHAMLKQGFDIEHIKSTLIKAGHDIARIERVSGHTFSLFHKDIIDYIEREIHKGRTIDDVKEDLLKIGHSEDRLKHIIHHHISKEKGKHWTFFHTHKRDLKLWVPIISFILLVVLISLAAMTWTLSSTTTMTALEKRMAFCDQIGAMPSNHIPSSAYHMLCEAMVQGSPQICTGQLENQCRDIYTLFTYYSRNLPILCDTIRDPAIKELCQQIHRESCNNFFGYGAYCEAVLISSIEPCRASSAPSLVLMPHCSDNYYMYLSFRGDNHCRSISDNRLQQICYAMFI